MNCTSAMSSRVCVICTFALCFLAAPALFQLSQCFTASSPSPPQKVLQGRRLDSSRRFAILRAFLSLISIVGLGSSIAEATRYSGGPSDENSLSWQWYLGNSTILAWFSMFAQSSHLLLERRFKKQEKACGRGCISSAILLVIIYSNARDDGLCQNTLPLEHFKPQFLTQFVATILILLLYLIYQPQLDICLKDNTSLDRQYAVSKLAMYSFAWCSSLLELARIRKLAASDLPKLDSQTRSRENLLALSRTEDDIPLWRRLISVHIPSLAKQWALMLLHVAFDFISPYIMLKFLKTLENPDKIAMLDAWKIAFTFGMSSVASQLIHNRLLWLIWGEMAIPLRGQLVALIFQKTMNLRVWREPTPTKTDHENPHISGAPLPVNPISHVTSDVVIISMFGAFNYLIPSCVLKFSICVIFLCSILGWRSILVGLMLNIVVIPINSYFIRKYNLAQQNMKKSRDQKLSTIMEALQALRHIKFSVLEEHWEDKLIRARDRELAETWRLFMAVSMQMLCSLAGPVVLATGALTTHFVMNGELDPSIAFTALSLFGQLEGTITMLPDLISDLIQAKTSIDRIDGFCHIPEKEDFITRSQGLNVSFDNATVTWPSKDIRDREGKFHLRNINLNFPIGELSVVSGDTGSGKSLLLAAILGEVDLVHGSIIMPILPPQASLPSLTNISQKSWIIPSTTAFVSQSVFIENTTIKANIIMSLPYDPIRYHSVLSACALLQDLSTFSEGDETEVGAQGIGLSGGQKWRVSFARALYSRAGILLLDDIFSAVDAHVGKILFDQGLCGILTQGRTRILVTHHIGLCHERISYFVRVGGGCIEFAGEFQAFPGVEKYRSYNYGRKYKVHDVVQKKLATNGRVDWKVDNALTKPPRKPIRDERRETGGIRYWIYKEYLQSIGGSMFWLFCILGFAGQQFLVFSRSWWLKIWTERRQSTMVFVNDHTQMETSEAISNFETVYDSRYYAVIYSVLSLTSGVTGVFPFLYLYYGSIHASRTLFHRVIRNVLNMPLRWIDTVPQGQIINRLTGDFATIDFNLPKEFGYLILAIFQAIVAVFSGFIMSSHTILLSLPLLGACSHFAIKYIRAARDVKRLESVAKSPIIESFRSVMSGLDTIRAYNASAVYMDQMHTLVDNHLAAWWYSCLFKRWLGLRMSLIGITFAMGIAFFILTRETVDPALAGFTMTFSMSFASSVASIFNRYSNMEMHMNSAERVVEYANLNKESEDGIDAPPEWPSIGKIEIKNLVLRYAPDLPPTLKGLNLSVSGGQRVGIIGRTGAGKSSLTLGLFRFLNADGGRILIDNIDISELRLRSLRKNLAIIPQDPMLFSGTVRDNLDPFGDVKDEVLIEALCQVGLANVSTQTQTDARKDERDQKNVQISLSTTISQGGQNLSQGQRQLICLARLLILQPKIIILDEATSAVDSDTESLIKKVMKEQFVGKTLIVIAHRISSVADFDRILVMSDGKDVEFGTPKELLQKKRAFWQLVKESSDKEVIINQIAIRETSL